jgi:hypothetical protein
MDRVYVLPAIIGVAGIVGGLVTSSLYNPPAPPPQEARPALPPGYTYAAFCDDGVAIQAPEGLHWQSEWRTELDAAAWAWCRAAIPEALPNTWEGVGHRRRACDDLSSGAP